VSHGFIDIKCDGIQNAKEYTKTTKAVALTLNMHGISFFVA
jgi:hypothetical protein